MANDTNLLLSARAVMAAVQHLPENGIQNATLGALQAMQDPAFTQLRQTINPLTMPKDNTLAWVTKAGRDIKVPRVTVTYRPKRVQSAINERTKPSTGTEVSNGSSIDVYYDQHKEFTWKKVVPKELLEPAAQNYIRALLGGNLSGGRVGGVDHMLSALGLEMFGGMVETIFEPANTYVLTTLIAAIGKNKAFPVLSTPTADAPNKEVIGYDAAGNPKRDMRNAIMDTILLNQIKGKAIVIGGLKPLQWHRDMKDYRTNQDGLDFVAVYGNMPWAFYFDPAIDTLLGEGSFLVLDANAAAFDSVNYHGPAGSPALYAGTTKNDNTYFDRGSIRFNQFKNDEPGLANTMGVMSMGFDLRIAELQDTNDQPEQLITPSFSYGMFTRPTGFFTANTSDVLNKVTGVYRFTMVDPT